MSYKLARRALWRSLPAIFQRPILRLLRWKEYSTACAVRRFAKLARSRFADDVVISPAGEIWFLDSSGAQFLVPSDHTDWIGRGVSQTEPFESELLSRNLGAGTMLDIGANVGIHSIRVALKLPGATVFAFEPVSANYAVLLRNIVRNRLSQRLFATHAAVGATQGTVMMPASFGTGNWVGGRIQGVPREEIPLLTIDSFLKEKSIVKVELVKCDVEGYELQVLRGMAGCLEAMRPRLLLEVSQDWCARQGHNAVDVFALLHGFGYEYMCVIPDGKGGAVTPPAASVSESLVSTNNFWFFPKEEGSGQVDTAN